MKSPCEQENMGIERNLRKAFFINSILSYQLSWHMFSSTVVFLFLVQGFSFLSQTLQHWMKQFNKTNLDTILRTGTYCNIQCWWQAAWSSANADLAVYASSVSQKQFLHVPAQLCKVAQKSLSISRQNNCCISNLFSLGERNKGKEKHQ